jgi:hypothetical protein
MFISFEAGKKSPLHHKFLDLPLHVSGDLIIAI